jgi:uncharacterized protein YkwD
MLYRRLNEAAFLQASYLTSLGFIPPKLHRGPADKPEVTDRCKAVHFKGFCGENASVGKMGPEDVVKRLMQSEGHKDNMLGNYATIGGSRVGKYWIQVFGGDAEGEIPKC